MDFGHNVGLHDASMLYRWCRGPQSLNHSTDSATPIMTVSTTDTEVDLMTSIRILVADKLNLSFNVVQPESVFRYDLGADSLDMFEIIDECEEVYDIKLNETDRDAVITVSDLHNLVQRKIRE